MVQPEYAHVGSRNYTDIDSGSFDDYQVSICGSWIDRPSCDGLPTTYANFSKNEAVCLQANGSINDVTREKAIIHQQKQYKIRNEDTREKATILQQKQHEIQNDDTRKKARIHQPKTIYNDKNKNSFKRNVLSKNNLTDVDIDSIYSTIRRLKIEEGIDRSVPCSGLGKKKRSMRKDNVLLESDLLKCSFKQITSRMKTLLNSGNLHSNSVNPKKSRILDATSKSSKERTARDRKIHSGRDAKADMQRAVKQAFFGTDVNVDLKPEVTNAFSTFTDSIAKIAESGVEINHTFNPFSGIIAGLTEGLGISNERLKLIVAMLFVFFMVNYTETENLLWKTGAAAILMYILYASEVDAATALIVKKVYNWFIPDETAHAQSSGKDNIIELLLAYLYSSVIRKSMSSKGDILADFLKSTRDVSKWRDGMSFTYDYFIEIVEKFLNFIGDQFGYDGIKLKHDLFPEVTKFYEEVLSLVEKHQKGAPMNWENGQILMELHKKGSIVMNNLPNVPQSQQVRMGILHAQSQLRPLIAKMERANIVGNGPRPEPLGIMLTGPTGVGKSTVTTPLMLEVTAAVLPKESFEQFRLNHNDFIYNRVHENEFYDGYHGQFNWLNDDIGATRDIAGVTANPYMESIRAINTANFPLHMAHLEEKGNTNFTSKIVWATSNRKIFELNSLYYNQAFCRRWAVCMLTVPKKEFCESSTVEIWDRKLKADLEFDDSFSHLEFFEYDILVGKIKNPVSRNYRQLIDYIVKMYKDRERYNARCLMSHEELKLEAIRIRQINEKASEAHCQAYDEGSPNLCQGRTNDSPKRKGKEKAQPMPGSFSKDETIPPQEYLARTKTGVSILNNTPMKVCEVIDKEWIRANSCEPILLHPLYEFWRDSMGRWDQNTLNFMAALSRRTPEEAAVAMEGHHEESWTEALQRIGDFTWKEDFTPFFESLKQRADKWVNVVKNVCKSIYDQCSEQRTLIKTLLLAVGLCTIGYQMYKSYMTPQLQYFKKNSNRAANKVRRAERDLTKRRGIQPRKSGKGHQQIRKGKTQLAYDPTCMDVMHKIWKYNMYCIRLPGSMRPMGYFTMIRGRIGMMPLHFGDKIDLLHSEGQISHDTPLTIWRVSNPDVKFEVFYKDMDIFLPSKYEYEDLCYVSFPDVIPIAKNIVKHVLDDFSVIDRKFTCALLCPQESSYRLTVTEALPIPDLEYEEYTCSLGFDYDIHTKIGDCGSLLAIFDPRTKSAKIIGMHTAGKGRRGMSCRVDRDMVEYALEQLGESDWIEEVEDESKPYEIEDVELQGFTAIEKGEKVHFSGFSKIVPSPLNDTYLPPEMLPALMRKVTIEGKVVDPWINARVNYAQSSYAMDTIRLKQCTESYISEVFKNSLNDAPWKPKIFSFEEAVAGVPGIENMEGIPRGTSAGWPLCLKVPKGHKGKTHFFGTNEEYEFTSTHCIELKKHVQYIILEASRGRRLKHVYLDFLKDERRPKEKVFRGKTRGISGGPLAHGICVRIYFLDFIRWFVTNRMRNGSAVGLNAYSNEWNILATKLNSESTEENIVAGDFSHWDGSLTRIIQRQFLLMADRFYGPDDSLIREVLFEDICNSKHIVGDVIYEYVCGMPTGNPLTAILNTFCNNVAIRYASSSSYLTLNRPEVGPVVDVVNMVASFLRRFEKQVFVICYGDDNVLSVGKNLRDTVNQVTLTYEFARFGFTYTPEDKGDSTGQKHRFLKDCSFLKRGFRFDDEEGRYVAPLSMETILESPQWTKENDVGYNFVKDNVFTCLKELALHEKEVFKKWAPKLVIESREKLEYVPPSTDYRVLRSLALATEL